MSIMSMRERNQGITTKIIIGLIIIAFAFFGLGSITTFLTPVAKVATVNGEDVTSAEMEVAVERNRRMMLQQGMTPETIDEDALRQEVLETLITRTLLTQAVEDLGLTASDASLDKALLETEVFQVNGAFDPNQYRLVLASAGYNPLSYREDLRIDQSLGQLAEAIQASAFITSAESERTSSLSRQTRDVAYMTFTAEAVDAEVTLGEDEALEFYEDNRGQFFSEETVDIEYVQLSQAAMMAEVEVSNQMLESFYRDRLDVYTSAERRQIAHILVAVTDDKDMQTARQEVEDIQRALTNGEDFATLAEARSDDPGSAVNGGDLGYIEPGIFVAPFEAAALELTNVGEVSSPVETEYGVHLIRLTNLDPAEVSSFEAVAVEVEQAFREEAVRERFVEVMSELDELAFEDDDLSGIETQLNLNIQRMDAVTRQSNQGIFASAKIKDAVFSPDLLLDGNNSSVIETQTGEAFVVRVSAYQESSLKTFEMVEEEINQRLRAEKLAAMIRIKADEAVAMLDAGSTTRTVAEQFDVEWSVSGGMTRYQSDLPKTLVDQAFAMPKPSSGLKSVGLAELSNTEVAVISITNVNNPEPIVDPIGGTNPLAQFLASQRGSQEFQAFQASLEQLGQIQGSGS